MSATAATGQYSSLLTFLRIGAFVFGVAAGFGSASAEHRKREKILISKVRERDAKIESLESELKQLKGEIPVSTGDPVQDWLNQLE
ncbi:hypothetical protein Gasu2_67580 [Galdieria sulphuraria]|uniref:Uncharacterized protein n=1 Tax=Galdieria sulphuraria TaxID=130081 RepID=M2W0H3_GALSU|nr:uncharacterized protein Gasu_35010 [Galdieria sulphuraria]EME29111.1 hypothetical protein Gasu_35010 [Galdieria sulphuraria]GJD12685.1 hypothetical protein Gasu2_67580 [Galdieria sulphuraria]|eukprot:XP_005705631.1 hypothetical protein Gasu_35010 [Galdieria sulphuraria]